jgi:hypothetical protein
VSQGAKTRPSPSLSIFESALDIGESWLVWIDEAEQFRAILKDKIPWDQLDETSRKAVQARLKTGSPANQLLLNSLYLAMAAAFEEFLRAQILEAALEVSAKKPKYEEVNDELRKLHLREAARLLRRLDSPPEYLTITTDELCAAIGSCVSGSTAVRLCEQALGDVDGLIRLENFFERMTALGRQLSFDRVARDARIAGALGLAGNQTRHAAKTLKLCVEMVSKNRNRIAHMGSSAADVDRTLLQEHRGVLRAVSLVICSNA